MKPQLTLEQQLERSVFHLRAKRLGKEKMANGEIVIHRDVSGPMEFSTEQIQLMRDGYAPGASEVEFRMLLEVARLRRLNPFLKQIHFVKRKSKDDNGNWRETWTSQVSIDGLRAIAQRTGLYDGQDEPTFERNKDGLILSARVAVYRKDWSRPAVGVARWDEYVQTTRDGKPTRFWDTMPHVMIGKCAEALALRKAFPEDLAGVYTDEEMLQADNSSGDPANLHLSPHSGPGEDPRALPKTSSEFDQLIGELEKADRELFDPGVEHATLLRWRERLGNKAAGIRTEFGARVSKLYLGDEISPDQKGAISKLTNRVDRKMTSLEAKLKAPPVESSFIDPEDDGTESLGAPERQPGEDDD